MKGKVLFIASLFVTAAMNVYSQTAYTAQVDSWRSQHQKELLADDGWLTVAGLIWLKDGVNTVGSGEGFDVQLTPNFKGGKFGEIDFQNNVATLVVEKGIVATSNAKAVSRILLTAGTKPATIQVGSQSFFLIEREGKYAIRLKDKQSPSLQIFTVKNGTRSIRPIGSSLHSKPFLSQKRS